jgi:hypothetical protein
VCQNFGKKRQGPKKGTLKNTVENRIKELETKKAYRYLGIGEIHNIEHKEQKERLKKAYVRRLMLIMATELSAKNKMQPI